jgi:hypothetical protein
MTMVVDAAPLVAVADRRDRAKGTIEALLRDEPGELIIAAPVTAEIDYLLGNRIGRDARLAFLADLAAERFRSVCLGAGRLPGHRRIATALRITEYRIGGAEHGGRRGQGEHSQGADV